MRLYFFLIMAVSMAAGAEPGPPTPTTADEIMSRVAVNQDRAERARAAFVYRQNIAVRLRDSHGKLAREEISDYQVTPDERRSHRERIKFSGRYRKGGSFVSYNKPEKGQDEGFRNQVDADLAHDLGEDLIGDRKSKDGVAVDLFPLTAKEQSQYRFVLKGEEAYQGSLVYRIAFEPKAGTYDACWKGEAIVSKADFEPLLVTTKLAHGIPLLVRTALGTNLQGLGFSVTYRKFDDGVWFPVSYGTEFRVRAVFIYSRQIAISMVSSDFHRADVTSSVEFDTVR